MTAELWRWTAREAVAALTNGDITPHDLIDAALARIAEVDGDVNAVPTVCEERARERADHLIAHADDVPKSGRGWLAGLPVFIKDLVDVEGRSHHTWLDHIC